MRVIATFVSRLRALRHKEELNRGLDDEVRFHLEMETAENVRRGMAPEEARYAALRRFGGVERHKEEWRERRFLTAMGTWAQDFGYAWRALLRARGLALFAVLSLALGIGANTAIFTLVRSLALRPLPYPEPGRLMRVYETFGWMGGSSYGNVSIPNLKDWRAMNTVFENVGAYSVDGVNLVHGAETVRVAAAHVESDVFRVMKVPPLLGRWIEPGENEAGKDHVVVLSYGLWQRRFGADPNIVGTRIGVEGAESVVVGVMPEGFLFPPRTRMDLWAPLVFPDWGVKERGSHFLNVIARLKEGTGWEAASLQMGEIARRLEKLHAENATRGVRVEPLHLVTVRGTVRILAVLWFAVGVVLLLACANVAHLMLARATGRRRELALRASLGASRWRLVRLFLIEGMLLGSAGAAAGFLAARWSADGMAALGGEQLPPGVPVQADAWVFLFCAVAALFSVFLSAVLPALNATHLDLQSALKEAGSATGYSVPRQRNLLMVWEVALALVLAAGALTLLRSLRVLNESDLGFNHENVLTMNVSVPGTYQDAERISAFYRRAVDAAGVLPGVTHAAAINIMPVQYTNANASISIRGRAAEPPGHEPAAEIRLVTSEYFQAMGIRLVRGRYFSAADMDGSERITVINRRMAERYWPGRDPLGQWIAMGTQPPPDSWMRVIGIVDNVRHMSPYRPPLTAIYLPVSKFNRAWPGMSLVLRSAVEPQTLALQVGRMVRELDPSVAVFAVRTMETVVNDATSGARLLARLLTIFGGLAVLLALVGVYGVMAYLVSQRTHEIGVRLTLGAARGCVLKMVLSRGLKSGLTGVALGTAGCMPLAFLMRHYLLGLNLGYVWAWAGAAAGILAVTLAATLLPAWRASQVDPLAALRDE